MDSGRGFYRSYRNVNDGKNSCFVATNQSAVGRGIISNTDLLKIHRKMIDIIMAAGGKISGIKYCPHLPDAACNCRKPKPGLLNQILLRII